MKATRIKYPAKVLAIAIVMLLAGTVSAWAHYVYQKGTVWTNGAQCLVARGEISHGIGFGYSKTDAWAYKPGYDVNGLNRNCYAAMYLAPRSIGAKNYLEKKTSSGSWAYCREDGTAFNTVTDYKVSNPQHWQSAGSQAWCGRGTYRTRGLTSVLFNGVRNYGTIYSGEHAL